MNGQGDPATIFSPGFLAKAPAEALRKITRTMRESYGKAEGVSRTELKTPFSGLVFVDLERSQLVLDVAVDPAAPHQVRGLLIRDGQ
jgi:hypothetical protein